METSSIDVRPPLIHEAFFAAARGTPEAVAIVAEDGQLTYRELEERARQFARVLHDLGIQPGDLIGVCLRRSPDLVAALLAVLMAGGAYVPMETTYPARRLAFIANDAKLALVLADDSADGQFGTTRVVSYRRLCDLAAAAPGGYQPARGPRPDDAAYIIYTSGSTGQPKGVVIPHRNVVSLIVATCAEFAFGRPDVWSWFHSVAFDFSVWEIFGCLLTGGRLVVVPEWTRRSPEDFHRLLADKGVTVLNQTPSAFTQLLAVECATPRRLALRLVIFGGEPLDTQTLLPWFDLHPESECRLVNMFGITETTVHVTAATITRDHARRASRSVGRAIPGWSVRIRGAGGDTLPFGTAGEIAVGGMGLALGYLNRPERTAARFVTDPLTGERLYLSGDRGRMAPDGSLEHLGRLDNQVKVRGHRIELDEIRMALLADPAVAAAAVTTAQRSGGDPASIQIIGYMVLAAGEPPSAAEDVRRRSRAVLPSYMVPDVVMPLAALPLTANGKLDAARLPSPMPLTEDGQLTYHAEPRSENTVRSAVEAAWRSVLQTSVGLDDNFFDSGGNSLLASRVVARLRELGFTSVTVRNLYERPTVRGLASAVGAASPAAGQKPAGGHKPAGGQKPIASHKLTAPRRADHPATTKGVRL